jgi:hypothetical protein
MLPSPSYWEWGFMLSSPVVRARIKRDGDSGERHAHTRCHLDLGPGGSHDLSLHVSYAYCDKSRHHDHMLSHSLGNLGTERHGA